VAEAQASELEQRFIRTLLRSRVVLHGDFTLKSGQHSSYFIDFGCLEAPGALYDVGCAYAQKIIEAFGAHAFDVVFGPSYKGIPLAAATSIALWREHGLEKPYSFNRKEEKDHGEGGLLMGHKPSRGDRIVIVDDVITDGGTKVEMIDFLSTSTEAQIMGIVVGVDRSPPGTVAAIQAKTGVAIEAITDFATIERLQPFLERQSI